MTHPPLAQIICILHFADKLTCRPPSLKNQFVYHLQVVLVLLRANSDDQVQRCPQCLWVLERGKHTMWKCSCKQASTWVQEFAVGVVSKNGEYRLIDSGALPEAVAASAAIPFVFEPVDVPGQALQPSLPASPFT